jgi:hypothetical protein
MFDILSGTLAAINAYRTLTRNPDFFNLKIGVVTNYGFFSSVRNCPYDESQKSDAKETATRDMQR